MDAQAPGAAASAVFHAVYALPFAHIGIIANVMSLQPAKRRCLVLQSGPRVQNLCMERASFR